MLFFFHFGRYVLLIKNAFAIPEKFRVYWKEISREMVSQGVGSLPIVMIIMLFMGAVTAVQTAYQLLSGLIPLSVIGQITRDGTILELGPTITMLVLAGRVGSNIASQIGTMRVTEQIDALEIMGVNAKGYLVMPKILAGITMLPLVCIIGIAMGNLGGYLACTLTGIVSPTGYITGLLEDYNPFILTVAIIKLFINSFIITSVSSYQGFYTTGGAIEVGQSSTRAVVFSCILVLLADYVIAQLLL